MNNARHHRPRESYFQARIHAVYSDLYQKNGDSIKAKESLCKTIVIFKECGADGLVEKTEKKLTEL